MEPIRYEAFTRPLSNILEARHLCPIYSFCVYRRDIALLLSGATRLDFISLVCVCIYLDRLCKTVSVICLSGHATIPHQIRFFLVL